ncbi:MAG: LacI family transcriptional regulator, partial [Spirochaetaceae bacterium]
MRAKPGLKIIAERAGVSVATVSRVLNDRPEVNQATRERVLRHAADVEHETHQNRPSTTSTLKIGFVNDYRRFRLDSVYVGGLLTGVHAAALGHSYSVALVDSDLIEREIR